MVKHFLIVIGFLFSIQVMAQTGIGTTTPHASAKLDVFSDNKGFLPPRVTLTSATDNTTIPSPAEGLLVYNMGSVGLQAGYYYWNGANWATIATATSAGNGVTASDMVKIYEGVGNAATINVNGATFSVTTSGRYSFDFSTSASCGNCVVTLNFQVRDGANSNAVIASDMQTSYSNNVHAEYNGKVEVNLIGGRSYNVLVTASNGNIYNNDYTRVYMKQVAGNLPVTGQSVDYIQASLSANQALSAVGNIIFNTSSGTGITMTSGGFNLVANKTYKLEAAIGGASAGYAYYGWVDNLNNLLPGGSIGAVIKAGNVHTDAPQDKAVVYFTPTVDTRVFLRVYNLSGTLTAYAPSLSTNFSSTWASIQQVGSSAIINPWTLSGTNTFNTTGNVGIGTTSPNASAILDITSTTKGVLIPRMTANQRVAISNPIAGLVVYQTNVNPGNYIFNGSSWDLLSNANYGDIKNGIQTADHNGWVLLNGRVKTSLSASQQAQATTLGIGATLPNATDAFLVQNGGVLGGVTGSNTIAIAQNQLPNVAFTGSIISVAHGAVSQATASGVFTRVYGGSYGNAAGGGSTNTFDLNIPLNGGVTQQNINITPKSLSVNTFIYLGY